MSICQEPWYNTYGSMMTRCYNKYADPKHYHDYAPAVIPAERSEE